MKKTIDNAVGVLACIGFLWAGLAICIWSVGKLQQSYASQEWPQVEGIVIESEVDMRRSEHKPLVRYTYTVAGLTYESRQISFDIFNGPGGTGGIEAILSRYPEGQTVIVYHDPHDPATATLEPAVYSPFFMPLVFGAIFISSGLYFVWVYYRLFWKGLPFSTRTEAYDPQFWVTAILSVLIYVAFSAVLFDSVVQETSVKAFGPRPAGIPNIVFVLALYTLLYLPMPWVFWHVVKLTIQAQRNGQRIGAEYLLTVGRQVPHSRKSQAVCIGGLLYVVALGAAWIAYTAHLGI